MICAVLLLVTVAIYWPVRNYDFVDYDDGDYIFNNPTVKDGLTLWGFVWAFVDVHVANWHPLTWLSHMLDCELFGVNPGAHHLVNLLFHCANSVLLFLLLRYMTGSLWRSAFAAALFAWHPLRVESVAWVSERKDVLSGLFFLLTIWAYARYSRQKDTEMPSEISPGTRASRTAYYWSLIFFTLGLLAKPMVVTLPFVLLVLDLWPLRRVKIEQMSLNSFSFFRNHWKLLKEKLPFFYLSALFCLITVLAQKSASAAANPGGFYERIGNVLVAYLRYLQGSFWPRDLTVLYLPQEIPTELAILAAVVLVGIFAVAFFGFRRQPYLPVGWLWFFGTLIPVIGLVPVGLQSHADRYTYLPSVGLSLMLFWGGHALIKTPLAQRKFQFIVGMGIVILLLVYAAVTVRQVSYWKNTETLMKQALAVDPNNYVAHSNLGVYYSKQGRTAEATHHYQLARELTFPQKMKSSSPR